jgi:hypothetical protein
MLFKTFNTYIAGVILESSAYLRDSARPRAGGGEGYSGDESRCGRTEVRPRPKGPVYFGRAGRMPGDAFASNFGRCPDSALTTCARSRRNSCIRDTRSSTFGTGDCLGPRPRLEGGRLFCTMKYFHNWSDGSTAKTRSKNRWGDCEMPGMSRQQRPRTKVSCKRYRYLDSHVHSCDLSGSF